MLVFVFLFFFQRKRTYVITHISMDLLFRTMFSNIARTVVCVHFQSRSMLEKKPRNIVTTDFASINTPKLHHMD